MNNYRRTKHSKKAAVIAAAAVVLLLLSGTYAWRDYTQHKSNEFIDNC